MLFSIALYIIIDLFFKLSPLISEIFILIVFLIVLSILSKCLDVMFAYAYMYYYYYLFYLSYLFCIFNSSIVSLSLIIVLVLLSKTCLILSSNNSFI